MMSPEKLDALIKIGELFVESLEEDANLDILKNDSAYIIQLAMLKTFKFIRNYEE